MATKVIIKTNSVKKKKRWLSNKRKQNNVLQGISGWPEIFCIEGLNMFKPSPVCQSGLLLKYSGQLLAN